MKILVIGRGWTGNKVFNELSHRNVEVSIIDHKNAIDSIKKYDSVINCAGVTGNPNIDACEIDKQETIQGNTIFPILLYKECEKYGISFSHFSTGCIYSGEINSVNHAPNFLENTYSLSKALSDTFLKDKSRVFRIRLPFTKNEDPKSYLTKIKNYSKNSGLYDSGLNSLSDHDEAIRIACDLVLSNASNGPYNLVNQGSISMKELADMMNLNTKWFTQQEFESVTKVKRPTCVIPAFEKMRPLKMALKEALDL